MNLPQSIWIPFLVVIIVFLLIAAIAAYRDAQRSKHLVIELLQTSLKALSATPADTRATVFTPRTDGTLGIYKSTDAGLNPPYRVQIPISLTPAGEAWVTSRPVARNVTRADFKAWHPSKESTVTIAEAKPWQPIEQSRSLAGKIRSVLAIPIRDSSGRTIGVLSLDSRHPLYKSGLGSATRRRIGEEIANLISSALIESKPYDPKAVPPFDSVARRKKK